MFWNSVGLGVKTLLHWQVWTALFLYVIVILGWFLVIALVVGRGEGPRSTIGCLIHLLGGSIYQAVVLGLLVMFLGPIMLGGDSHLPAGIVLSNLGLVAKASILALVALFLLSVVPILGGFLQGIPGIDVFIQGVVVFRIISAAIIEQLMPAAPGSSLYPGLLMIIGFFAISFVLSGGVMLLAVLFPEESTSQFLWSQVAGRLFGLLPLFMYSNYVGLQIRHFLGAT